MCGKNFKKLWLYGVWNISVWSAKECLFCTLPNKFDYFIDFESLIPFDI